MNKMNKKNNPKKIKKYRKKREKNRLDIQLNLIAIHKSSVVIIAQRCRLTPTFRQQCRFT